MAKPASTPSGVPRRGNTSASLYTLVGSRHRTLNVGDLGP
jgi:hypothetical protein